MPTLSEGLPGVHSSYIARDEQFDAETRSFNGLFEEDDADGTDEEIAAAAALGEVDDFDESEAVMSQHLERTPGDVREVGGEEGLSDPDDGDDEDTSFSVGPNHLDFVTLPEPRRGFNPEV